MVIVYNIMVRGLLNLIYPPVCPVCRVRTDKDQLCQDCLSSIKMVAEAVNEIRYYKKDVYYTRLYSVGCYEGILKEAIHLFKYRGTPGLARTFSQLLIGFAQSQLNMNEFDLMVAVPLHGVKLREREFNQSELLAEALAKSFGIPLLKGKLQKIKPTHPQSSLKKEARMKNLKDAFDMRGPESFREKSVLLVDDVFTTGVTVNECARALLSAGAASVSVLTLARGE